MCRCHVVSDVCVNASYVTMQESKLCCHNMIVGRSILFHGDKEGFVCITEFGCPLFVVKYITLQETIKCYVYGRHFHAY